MWLTQIRSPHRSTEMLYRTPGAVLQLWRMDEAFGDGQILYFNVCFIIKYQWGTTFCIVVKIMDLKSFWYSFCIRHIRHASEIFHCATNFSNNVITILIETSKKYEYFTCWTIFKIILLGIISEVCIARTSGKTDSGLQTAMTSGSVPSWARSGSQESLTGILDHWGVFRSPLCGERREGTHAERLATKTLSK